MTVVDRYLMAVRIFLPRSAQRDVVAELSDDIQSRIEDREGTLGRPLTAAEQEAIVADLARFRRAFRHMASRTSQHTRITIAVQGALHSKRLLHKKSDACTIIVSGGGSERRKSRSDVEEIVALFG